MENSYINDLEKDALVKFNNDPIMRAAVKKVLLAGIYGHGVLEPGKPAVGINWVFNVVQKQNAFGEGVTEASNEKIGEDVKAKVAGIVFLEEAFNKLSEYKVEDKKPIKEEVNPAS